MLEKLLQNKSIQSAFLGQLKKTLVDEGITCVVITTKDNGEFDTKMYKEPIKILTVEEYNKLINTIQSQL